MKLVGVLTVLLLTACQSERPYPKIVLGPNPIEPLWSRYVGCSAGIEIGSGTVSVAHRIGEEYEVWLINAASGDVINVATRPTRIGRTPNDTRVEISAGSVKPLDISKAASATPQGFRPVILTDRFLFAKRTRTHFGRFRFYSEGQVVVIDLPSRHAVWTDEGLDIAVIAAAGRVIVCHDRQTSIFANNAGRPSEVSEFYAALRAGNVSAVRKLYPIWRKSGMHDVDGKVPLAFAAKDGRLDIARLLVELGESPSAVDADGFSPLMMALHWNHADVGDFLLDGGAIPNDDGPLWGSALRIAVHEGRRPIIIRLLRSGAKIDFVETWSGHTALHEAVMYRNYEAIETLISAGANVKALDKDGKTPGALAPIDPCVIHLFGGGLIKDEPVICQPTKHETGTFKGGQLLH